MGCRCPAGDTTIGSILASLRTPPTSRQSSERPAHAQSAVELPALCCINRRLPALEEFAQNQSAFRHSITISIKCMKSTGGNTVRQAIHGGQCECDVSRVSPTDY